MATGQFLLLVLVLCVFSVSADVFVSLDCGSSETYTDENSIVWLGDEEYVSNGESQVVQSSNSVSHVMDTLRVFTSRNKNCYLIEVENGGKVLIRASFNYGNYDGKSNPPSFSLQFDGNDWGRVTTMSDQPVFSEAIYVVKGDYLSVCLAQTVDDQFPFISALEVRSLDSTMYSHIVDTNHALFLRRRVAFGSNQTIRYIDDPYDRLWSPGIPGNSLQSLTSDATTIDTTHGDKPPQQVLQNAISTTNSSDIITWDMNFLSTDNVQIYMNMYFSEVTQLDANQTRAFMIFKDNESFPDTILPPYGDFVQLYVSNLTVSLDTSFSIVRTTNSTLPPLINALEIFIVGDALTDGTNTQDVESLAILQNEFEVLQDWIGDPCLPSPFTWDWVNCSSSDPPRITALYLSKYNLSGSLPDFSSMDALQTIDLSDNSLDGPIPDFLGTLPNLKELNLANNQFSGPIPASLSDKNGLTTDTSGNPDLCSTSDESCQNNDSSSPGNDQPATRSSNNRSPNNKNKKKKSKLPIILGTTIPAFLLVWAVVGIFAILHYKNKVATTSAVNPGQTSGGSSAYEGAQGNNVKNVQMAENFDKIAGQHENSTTV